MLTAPMDILKAFPVRKTKKQKQAFRADVQAYAESLGYVCTIEKGSFGAKNIVIGDPEKAKYVVTAHYDTPAGMVVPNLITPCNPVTFLLYQLLIVGLFILVSVLVGAGIGILVGSSGVAGTAGMTVYWLMLFMMMFGPANKNNANDNTSGVVTVLEIARTLPELHRDKVCFVLFDLEEAGLIGSASYRKAHKKATENQIVLNMDCVGDGDHIIFFPTKKAKKNEALMRNVKRVGGWFGQKHIQLKDKGFYTYPSDQKNFPVGFGIAAFRKVKGVGYYCGRIHTKRDTILEETNVNLLRAALSTLISCDGEC